MTDFPPLVDELLPLLRRLCEGEYGIALGEAHAKEVADAESDIDLYLFTRQPRPGDERARIARQFSPEIDRVTCWGVDDSFEQSGTDFYVQGAEGRVLAAEYRAYQRDHC